MPRLTKEQWSKILERSKKESIALLSQEYGINQSTIYKKIKALGGTTQQLSKETWEEILSQVQEVSGAELARRYGVTAAAISYQIKARGIEYKPHIIRKHAFNEDFFETIDTEEKAYFLGFIIADGMVSKSTRWGSVKRLVINISAKDIQVLEAFKKAIGAESIDIQVYEPHASTYGTEPMAKIVVNSSKMCTDLAKYGVVPNKTGKEFLPKINESLVSHLIRGYFDGDGHICLTPKPSFGFTGGYDLLDGIKNYLQSTSNVSKAIKPRKDYRGKKVYDLRYGAKKDVLSFYNVIYSNASIYLERKYKKYSKLLSQQD